jgi:hypothetical protein
MPYSARCNINSSILKIHLSSRDIFNIKKWIFETCESFCKDISEARIIAYNSIEWWEYLLLSVVKDNEHMLPLTVPYAQLYALVCINVIVNEKSHGLSYNKLLDIVTESFQKIVVYKIQLDIEALNLHKLNIKPCLIEFLNKLLFLLPQSLIIRNFCITLLDNYILNYCGHTTNGEKVAASILYISRKFNLDKDNDNDNENDKDNEIWPLEYTLKINLKPLDFENENYFKIICFIACNLKKE